MPVPCGNSFDFQKALPNVDKDTGLIHHHILPLSALSTMLGTKQVQKCLWDTGLNSPSIGPISTLGGHTEYAFFLLYMTALHRA